LKNYNIDVMFAYWLQILFEKHYLSYE